MRSSSWLSGLKDWKGQGKSQQWNPSKESHILPASQQSPRALKTTRCAKNIPDLHLRCTRTRVGERLPPCSRGASAITPWDLGALVTERGQLSGTSRRVVMLIVMDASKGRRCVEELGVVWRIRVTWGGRTSGKPHSHSSEHREMCSVPKRCSLVWTRPTSMNPAAVSWIDNLPLMREEGIGVRGSLTSSQVGEKQLIKINLYIC